MKTTATTSATLLVLTVLWAGEGAAQPLMEQSVQAPTLTRPERGALVGSLAELSFSPADLPRGTFSVPSPFASPSERGPLLAEVFPTYAPEGGISEWGMGFQNAISIQRFRISGDIDYATDELTSPWGRMQQGDDGAWYVVGLRARVRCVLSEGDFTAHFPDGSTYSFRSEDAIRTPFGTYAWMLSEATSALGDRTRLEYERNDSGRPFLRRVSYGGRRGPPQNELELIYEPTPASFQDFRSGQALLLDRRVKTVVAKVRSSRGGHLEERWRHELEYRSSSTGPAYYLRTVTRIHRSGAAEPPVHYEYDLGDEYLAQVELTPSDGLNAALTEHRGLLLPENSTLTDVDEDGLVDVEHAYDQSLYRHTPEGWVKESLPEIPNATRACRGPANIYNMPRHLVRMMPGVSEPQVIATWGGYPTTNIAVCDRAGREIFNAALPRNWVLGPATRLVDLNHDDLPEIISVHPNGYRVLENVSLPGRVDFREHPAERIRLPQDPGTVWFHDMNGDGLLDLIVKSTRELIVYFGRTGLRFQEEPQFFRYRGEHETQLDMRNMDLVFLDANKDGLTDVLIWRGYAVLLTNHGGELREARVPAVRRVDSQLGIPVAMDLTGSGEAELNFSRHAQLRTIQLTRPSTGLMVRADDGKGGLVRFFYARGPASPGAGRRPVVLDRMVLEASGYDPLEHQFIYERPKVHSTKQVFLGYEITRRLASDFSEEAEFTHGDDISGLLMSLRSRDTRAGGLERFVSHAYEPRSLRGIPWVRLQMTTTGVRSPESAEPRELTTTTEWVAYEDELCASFIRSTLPNGILEAERLMHPRRWPEALPACLVATERHSGRHADPSLDFTYTTTVARNRVGLPTALIADAEAGPLTLQTVEYDAEHRLTHVHPLGAGSTVARYSPGTGLLERVTAPDGVVMRAAARDPVSDALRSLESDRGARRLFSEHFGFDGLERLAGRWDNLRGGSETDPLESWTYRYATHGRPASHQTRTRLAASGARREVISFSTAAGEPLGEAQRTSDGWSLSELLVRSRARRELELRRRPVLAGDVDFDTLGHEDLLQDTWPISTGRTNGFGEEISTWQQIESGVTRETSSHAAIVDGGLVFTHVENGTYTSRVGFDVTGQRVWSEDAAGYRTRFERDVLGRLTSITLPNGDVHRTYFDDYARKARVERSGVGAVIYEYDPASGRLARKRYESAQGEHERTVDYTYDAVGRVKREVSALAETGATRSFEYDYDGVIEGEAPLPGQRGRLSRVAGDAYEKRMKYRPDGLLEEVAVSLGDWRTLVVASDYWADGAVRTSTHTVRSTRGEVLLTVAESHLHDSLGRPSTLQVDGAVVYSLTYDGLGRIDRVDFQESGAQFVFHYDPVTQAPRGYWADSGTWQVGFEWHFDARGLVRSEVSSSGDVQSERTYTHDARRYLDGSTDSGASASSSYGYTSAGLPERIDDQLGARTIDRTRRSARVGSIRYTFDELGRVARRGSVGLEYGPNGDIAVARRGSREWSYFYDESGQRVLKLRDGRPEIGFVGQAVLTEDTLIQPVRVAGHLIGVLENGRFRMVLTDPRGTILRSQETPDEPASAYGVRSSRGDLAFAIDYAGQGYDPDLGTVRMGVRDYDPYIAQFWVADPLMLEAVDACSERPVECSLYGYAGNDPLLYVDPSGQRFTTVDLIRWRDAFAHGALIGIAKVGGAVDVAANSVLGRGEAALERYDATLAQLEACAQEAAYSPAALQQGESLVHAAAIPPLGGSRRPLPEGVVEVFSAKKAPIPTVKPPDPGALGAGGGARADAGRTFVTTPNGKTVPIPEGWVGRTADSGKGIVYQRPGATGNADMIRVMEPTTQYPSGYVRYYNQHGQPLDVLGKPGSQATTHIPLNYEGPMPRWPK